MSTVRVSEIVILLRNNPVLVKEWQLFYHSLKPRIDRTQDFQAAFNKHLLNSVSLFTKIISQWASENGERATIQELAKILQTISDDFDTKSTSDTLLASFNPTALVVAAGGSSSTGSSFDADSNVQVPH